jgi:hypothetical protein
VFLNQKCKQISISVFYGNKEKKGVTAWVGPKTVSWAGANWLRNSELKFLPNGGGRVGQSTINK